MTTMTNSIDWKLLANIAHEEGWEQQEESRPNVLRYRGMSVKLVIDHLGRYRGEPMCYLTFPDFGGEIPFPLTEDGVQDALREAPSAEQEFKNVNKFKDDRESPK